MQEVTDSSSVSPTILPFGQSVPERDKLPYIK
jgi:hypothetical protein